MSRRYGNGCVVLLMMSLAIAMASLVQVNAELQQGYYHGKCVQKELFGLIPSKGGLEYNVEKIVEEIVRKEYKSDKTIVAALLRMQFHDCFVHGCDASILLDGQLSEKQTPPNLSVRGYDLIDKIKDELEKKCPGVVSCADIIVMATRTAVFLGSGSRSGYNFQVKTGRKDSLLPGTLSVTDLPPPTAGVEKSLEAFNKKNLDAIDYVYLLGGGHTVGVTHCKTVKDRIESPESTMSQDLRRELKDYCTDPNNPIDLDPRTPLSVDKLIYYQLAKKGILVGDQEMATHPITKPIVDKIMESSDYEFGQNFGRALVKLQAIEAAIPGHIRTHCRI